MPELKNGLMGIICVAEEMLITFALYGFAHESYGVENNIKLSGSLVLYSFGEIILGSGEISRTLSFSGVNSLCSFVRRRKWRWPIVY